MYFYYYLVSPSSQPFLHDATLVRNLDRMAEISSGPVYNSLTEPVSPSSSENSIVIEDGTVKIKRKLGLMSGTALIVGTMIGKHLTKSQVPKLFWLKWLPYNEIIIFLFGLVYYLATIRKSFMTPSWPIVWEPVC